MKLSETFSLLSTAGLTALAILMAVPGASAQGTQLPQIDFPIPPVFQIPPADKRALAVPLGGTPQQAGHSVLSDSGRERRNRRILPITVVRLTSAETFTAS